MRFAITTLSEALQTGCTGSYQGEFSRHKEGIESYESQNGTNFEENVHGLPG